MSISSLFRPWPRRVSGPLAVVILVAWAATMAALVNREYLQASTANLATDLARYGPTAVWSGVYYRGDKIGFTVSQTTRTDSGFELQEDGRLQMLLLGQDTAASIRTTARVDTNFVLQSFEFSLDPGTGPVSVQGVVAPPAISGGPYRLELAVTSAGVRRTETRELPDAPVLSQNLGRLLAGGRLVPGSEHQWMVIDPATLRNAPVLVRVGDRTMVRTRETLVPAFRVEMRFQGLQTTAWVTDTGDIVREESPLGLMTIREPADRAQGLAIPARVEQDLLQAAAVVPSMAQRIDEPRDVRRLRLRFAGLDIDRSEMEGVGQTFAGDVLEVVDAQSLRMAAAPGDLRQYLAPEPLIESDAPEIRAEVEAALRPASPVRAAAVERVGVEGPAAPAAGVHWPADAAGKAERLTRYVNALLDKKPTVSLPSAVGVLRTKVGDCNEHTALYVAMARAAGLPSRIAVGLVYVHGAFYYHAWPEVYLQEPGGRGLWLPVDPTLNQFPADATHIRLARGGLDRQAAILPLIGRLRIQVLDVEFAANTDRVIVGREPAPDFASVPLGAPRATSECRCARTAAGEAR